MIRIVLLIDIANCSLLTVNCSLIRSKRVLHDKYIFLSQVFVIITDKSRSALLNVCATGTQSMIADAEPSSA